MTRHISGDLESFCDLLAHENAYLKAAEWEKVTDLLKRKQAYIEKFQGYIQQAQKAGQQKENGQTHHEMSALMARFTSLMQENEQLLKNAIAAQTSLVKMVMGDVSQDEHLGYGPNGREVKNVNGTTGLAIKNDV